MVQSSKKEPEDEVYEYKEYHSVLEFDIGNAKTNEVEEVEEGLSEILQTVLGHYNQG